MDEITRADLIDAFVAGFVTGIVAIFAAAAVIMLIGG